MTDSGKFTALRRNGVPPLVTNKQILEKEFKIGKTVKKDFWNDFAVFTESKLGPTEIRYLESALINRATNANSYSVENLAKIFFENGEEKNSKRIAKSIVENRPLSSTLELSGVIKSAITYKNPKFVMSTVKRCFQALRIYINNELEEIEMSLNEISKYISSNGVIICISFSAIPFWCKYGLGGLFSFRNSYFRFST